VTGTVLLTLVAIGVFLQAGAAVVTLVFPRTRRPELVAGLALAYGFGVGAVSTQLLLYSVLRVRFTLPSMILPWAAFWAIYMLASARRVARPTTDRPPDVGTRRISPASVLVAAALSVVVLSLLFRATFFPLWSWDSWAIWALKAKAFYYHRDTVPFVLDPYYALTHPDYPLLLPLAGTALFLVIGQAHDIVQIVTVLFYAASLVLFNATLRRSGTPSLAAGLFTAALAFAPNILSLAPHYLAEQAMLWYTLATIACVLGYVRSREGHLVLAGGLAAGFLSQVRPEGWLLAVPCILLLVVDAGIRRRGDERGVWRAPIVFAVSAAAIYAPWVVFARFVARTSGGVSQVGTSAILEGTKHLPRILNAAGEWMTTTALLGPYVLLFPVALMLVVLGARKHLGNLSAWFLLVALGTTAVPSIVLLMTLPYWTSVSGMGRYLYLFTAVTILIVALATSRAWLTGEATRPRRVSIALVVAALLAAVVVSSAPRLAPHWRSPMVNWSFEQESEGWRGAFETIVTRAGNALALQSPSAPAVLVSPQPLDVDADVNRVLRVTIRGVRTKMPGQVSLLWRARDQEYSWSRATTETVRWTGAFQTVTFRPHWTGVVDELRLDLSPSAYDSEPKVFFVRSVQSEGRWSNLLGLVLTRHAQNPWLIFGASIALLVAFRAVYTVQGLQVALPGVAAGVLLVFWVLADTVPTFTAPFSDGRPIRTVADTVKWWVALAPLSGDERIAFLEHAYGRPHLAPLIEYVRDRCPIDRDVLLFAPERMRDAAYGGYVFQKAGYRLFPRKVYPVHGSVELAARVLRHPGAIIVYEATLPQNIEGVAFEPSAGFKVVCNPRVVH
jgi:hypothetical protein